LPRLSFRVPDRDGLPPLERYAALRVGDERRTVGYTEATRGCKHRCRHCPIVPVYDGRFRVVSAEVVVEDVRRQVAQGARHITFGDPDFFNGPTHAMTVVDALAAACPGVSYDVTIKVEHLLRHVDLLPRLRDTGCVLVTSAVESLDDRVLARLEKGHTRIDVARAVAACRDVGLALTPTFVAFTPWTTADGYRELLRGIAALDLIDAVASIQLGIRLLVTEGSRLLELDDVRRLVAAFDRTALVYPWRHPDPAVDALQQAVTAHVCRRVGRSRAEVFRDIRELAHGHAPDALDVLPAFPPGTVTARADVPWLDEPWYC
jgi:DNA repair photolyase